MLETKQVAAEEQRDGVEAKRSPHESLIFIQKNRYSKKSEFHSDRNHPLHRSFSSTKWSSTDFRFELLYNYKIQAMRHSLLYVTGSMSNKFIACQ